MQTYRQADRFIPDKVMPQVTLGLGLLSIGRRWGVRDVAPPDANAAIVLIHRAIASGIRFLDTAPAYGTSEERLGQALRCHPALPGDLVVATKVGEHWVDHDTPPRVDHRFDSMVESLERSLRRLGRIDILQIHKANEDVVRSKPVENLAAHARSLGIGSFGASVATPEAGLAALETGLFDWLQFPFNAGNDAFSRILGVMTEAGARAIVNRPLAMGASAGSDRDRREAFRHVIDQPLPAGSVVLTGTSSVVHLDQNIAAFHSAQG